MEGFRKRNLTKWLLKPHDDQINRIARFLKIPPSSIHAAQLVIGSEDQQLIDKVWNGEMDVYEAADSLKPYYRKAWEAAKRIIAEEDEMAKAKEDNESRGSKSQQQTFSL